MLTYLQTISWLTENEALEDRVSAAQDLLEGLAPLAGAIAMGAALPSFAVVSSTAMFGLIATSKLGIVAHIVEGSGLAKAANALAMGTNPVAATVSSVAQVVQLVQNERIKAGIAGVR